MNNHISTNMKNFLIACVFLNLFVVANAQNYLTGKLIDNQGHVRDINYDRTESALSTNIFRSEYKVLSKKGTLLYNVTITHDQLKSQMTVAVKTEGNGVKGAVIEYDENECGLIFSDRGNMDTVFIIATPFACD